MRTARPVSCEHRLLPEQEPAAVGRVPADLRLGGDDRAGAQAQLRLEDQLELVALDRPADRRFERAPAPRTLGRGSARSCTGANGRDALAWYMAMSAAFIRRSDRCRARGRGRLRSSRRSATDWPAGLNGSARAASAPSRSAPPRRGCETSGRSMVNSSPARRASKGGASVPSATSALRTTRRRLATMTSTWSPWAWPSRSLTSLKPSRSMNSKAAPLSRERQDALGLAPEMDPVGKRGDRIVHRHRLGVVEIGADLLEQAFHRGGERGHLALAARPAPARRDRRGRPRAAGRSARRRRGHGRCWAVRRRSRPPSARTGR